MPINNNAAMFDVLRKTHENNAIVYNGGYKTRIEEMASLQAGNSNTTGKTIAQLTPEQRKELMIQFSTAQLQKLALMMAVMRTINLENLNKPVQRDSISNAVAGQTANLNVDDPMLRALKTSAKEFSIMKLINAMLHQIDEIFKNYQLTLTVYIDSITKINNLQFDQPREIFVNHAKELNALLTRADTSDFFGADARAYISGMKNELITDNLPTYEEALGIEAPPSYYGGITARPHPNTNAIYEKVMQEFPYDPNLGVDKALYTNLAYRMSYVLASRNHVAADIGNDSKVTAAVKNWMRPTPHNNMWPTVQKLYNDAVKKLEAMLTIHTTLQKTAQKEADKLQQYQQKLQKQYEGIILLCQQLPPGAEVDSLLSTANALRTQMTQPILNPVTPNENFLNPSYWNARLGHQEPAATSAPQERAAETKPRPQPKSQTDLESKTSEETQAEPRSSTGLRHTLRPRPGPEPKK